jgi:hypothetical protein
MTIAGGGGCKTGMMMITADPSSGAPDEIRLEVAQRY